MSCTLSKSDFKVAQTCPTKLYYKELGYPSISDLNPYLRQLAMGGYMVGNGQAALPGRADTAL